MNDRNRPEPSRSPRVKRTSRMLEQLPGEYEAFEFSTELDEETIRELTPDEAAFEYTVPGFVYGSAKTEREIVLWPLSLN